MSTNFTGVTFAQQKVLPSDDAIIRRAILPDGVLYGCDMSYSGSTLTMAAGQLLVCGRQIRHPSSQNWAVVDATSGFARLLLTVDMTLTSTKEVFEQVVDSIEYASAEDGFPDLEQTDINVSGSRYQIVVCVVSLGAGGITGIVSQLEKSKAESSGGSNFSVVGGETQPSDPKENTIWVKTDTEIAGYILSPDAPMTPGEGMVWIYAGTSGNVQFNALKKNALIVYPGSVMQFVGGVWQYADAYIFQNKQWIQFALAWDGYYFQDGEQHVEITGGWTSDGWNSTGTTTAGSILEVSSSSASKAARIGTVNPIDLTDVDTLYFDSTTGKNGNAYSAYLYVSTAKDHASIVAQATITEVGMGSIDVSGLSGDYYLWLYTLGGSSGSGYGSVRAIWKNNASASSVSDVALLSLDDDASDNAVQMVADGVTYGVNNITLNESPTEETYDFTVL